MARVPTRLQFSRQAAETASQAHWLLLMVLQLVLSRYASSQLLAHWYLAPYHQRVPAADAVRRHKELLLQVVLDMPAHVLMQELEAESHWQPSEDAELQSLCAEAGLDDEKR